LITDKITVICCTANRKPQIVSFINFFLKNFPNTKLIVVENSKNCDVFEQLKIMFSNTENLEIVFSPISGLSNARNIGLALTKTPFVVFTDDDCVPQPQWLENILHCFEEQGADVVGGKIEPIWPVNRTESIKDQVLLDSLALVDMGANLRQMEDFEFAVGANMAFRTSILNDIKFDTNLGRIGATLLSGEEIEFQKELRVRNAQFYYTPHAVVRHKIERERLEPTWFLSRFAWQGVSDAKSDIDPKEVSFHLHKMARELRMQDFVTELLSPKSKNLVERSLLLRYLLANALMLNVGDNVESSHRGGYFKPVNHSANTLAVEFSGFHDFLLKSIDSKFVHNYIIEGNPWLFSKHDISRELTKIYTSIVEHGNIQTLIFTSIDSFLSEDVFPTFFGLLESFHTKIKLGIHRIPNPNEFLNLEKLVDSFEVFVFSKSLQESLLSQGIKVDAYPVMGNLFIAKPLLNESSQSAIIPASSLKLLHLGEVREEQLPNILELVLEVGSENYRNFGLQIVGGCSDRALYSKILNLTSRYPGLVTIDDFYFYDKIAGESFKVVDNFRFIKALEVSDAVIKIQLSEKYAASAVVADCINLAVPVITISGSESASQVRELWSDFTIKDTSRTEIARVMNRISNSKNDKCEAYELAQKNRESFNDLFLN
jgi:GT2 family glycosyltransferase